MSADRFDSGWWRSRALVMGVSTAQKWNFVENMFLEPLEPQINHRCDEERDQLLLDGMPVACISGCCVAFQISFEAIKAPLPLWSSKVGLARAPGTPRAVSDGPSARIKIFVSVLRYHDKTANHDVIICPDKSTRADIGELRVSGGIQIVCFRLGLLRAVVSISAALLIEQQASFRLPTILSRNSRQAQRQLLKFHCVLELAIFRIGGRERVEI